jgi:hypothetical protein
MQTTEDITKDAAVVTRNGGTLLSLQTFLLTHKTQLWIGGPAPLRFGTGYVHIFVEADLVSVFFLFCGLTYEFAWSRACGFGCRIGWRWDCG